MAEEMIKPKTGTTTLGMKVKDAVILCADTQVTYGNAKFGDDIVKIEKINDQIAMTIAGSVGDNQALVRFLRQQANFYEIEKETPMTVKAAVTLMSNVLQSNKFYPFMISFIVGGFNAKPHLYSIEWDGSTIEKDNYTLTGSGFEFGLSVMDQFYKPNMTEEEGIELAVKTIAAAKKRDLYTGGIATTVVVIDKAGVRKLKDSEIDKIINATKAPKKKE